MKLSFLSVVVLPFLIFTHIFGQETSLSKESTNSKVFHSSQKEELPEDVVYERFFQNFKRYNDEADKQEQLGFSGRARALRNHFSRKLVWNEQQTQQLAETANQFHHEAETLKNQFRELKVLVKIQPENQDLLGQIRALRNQRNSLWSKYRDSLEKSFGKEMFEEFKKFLQQEIAGKVKRTKIEKNKHSQKETKDFNLSAPTESSAEWIYTDSSIDYDPDEGILLGFSITTANGGGTGTPLNYQSDFCDWEESMCTMVTVEATMFDYEDFPIAYDAAQSCTGEASFFLYGFSEEFESGEYVIDGYHEANYTANSSSCSLQAPDFTDFSGDNINIVIPKVNILLNGTPITNTTREVIVGQQINLSATVTGGTPSNPQWSIPGYVVKDYVINYTNPTSPSSAVATGFSGTELTQSTISFYWILGLNSYQVDYSVTINNRRYTGKATFDVKSPTVTVATQTETTTIYTKGQHQELLFGEINRFGGGKFGITFTKNNFQMPAGFSGDTVWVQVIDYAYTATLTDGQTTKTASGIGLDSRFPYSDNDPNAFMTRDLPGACLRVCDNGPPSFITMQTRINADMYLMFKPSNLPTGVNSIYVPLKKVSWNWTAVATRRPDFLFDLTSGSNSQNPVGEITPSFPEWSKIVTGGEPYQ